jgi:deazaflavin-dependent oxidoreductase (nitroreductase family)
MFAGHETQLWGCAGSEVMEVGGSVASHPAGRSAKPVLGLRRKPSRLAVVVFRLPLPLYRRGWGGLLGHTFLLLVHAGRKTGKLHSTVAMVLRYDRQTHEAVICSAWGQRTDWIRNIRARPALQVQIGHESFTPQQRFLSEEEGLAVVAGFRRAHPQRLRLLASILAGGISAPIPPRGTSSAFGSSCLSARPIPHEPDKAMPMVNEDRAMRSGRSGHW